MWTWDQAPFWTRFWDLFYPHKKYPPRDVPIVATVFYLSLIMFIARTLRWVVKRYIPTNLQIYFHAFINAWQGCSCSLENSITKRYYGKIAYCVQSFVLAFWFQWTWPPLTSGNPCGNWMHFIEGRARFFSTLLKMTLQMLGGLTAYRYARFFWYLELCNGHAQRYSMIECFSDLKVAVPIGFMLEFLASFTDKFMCKITFINLEKFEQFFHSVVGIAITLAGIHLTGMYFNPANATQQTFGCHGTSPPEHIFVYWVGPLLGCSCAVKLHAQMRAWWKGGAIETSDSAAATDIPAKDHGKALDQKTIEGNGNVMEVNYNHQSGDAQLKAKTD